MYQLRNINVNRAGRQLLSIDQLTIDPRGFTVVLGHNGSGKSTLLNILARQLAPDCGELHFNEAPLHKLKQRELAQQIAYLPQHLPEAPGLSVRELVKLGRFPWRGVLGRYRSQDYQFIEEAMGQTATHALADSLVDQLSGGERQRAWVAMLLAQQSPLLILDEPTAALDLAHQYELLRLLKKLHSEQGRGVIVVLHDINLALRFADQVLTLQRGKVTFQGGVERFANAANISELFGIEVEVLTHRASKVAVVC